jgi:hypothetical protein
MAKKIIRTGTTADPTGDSLKSAFVKVNDNFTELYNALGLDADTLNIGAFEFAGSTMTTTDSSAIVIDQAATITSNLSVGGDLLPQTANGGDLGSSTLPWKSLYVSNNTIYIGGTAVGLDANGNLTTGGTVVGSTPAWNSITGKPTFAAVATSGAYADLTGKPTIPTDFRGSVFADDSTLMIDAVDNKIYATELTVAVGNFVNVNSNNVEVENINGLSSQINFTVGGYNNLVIENNLVTIQNVSLSVAGDITLGGDIRSEGNINIDINLADSTLRRWQFGEDGELTFPDGTNQTTAYTGGGGTSIPAVVTTGAVGVGGQAHVKVQFTVASATTVTAVGVTVIGISTPASGRITLSGSPGTGSFDIVAATNVVGETFILMPFATNASGTGYGAPIAGTGTDPCYVKGTMITMADMSRVAVENITYHDDILVWDFDLGEFASATPLWIKKTQTTVVSCLLTFSDYSELRIVGDSPKAHRIFNKEAGKFTYGSMPETPIGTTTFNDQGEEITLISKEWIVGEVEFYNVMTDYHMNLFANSILTSMRYNNLYPITDMKFVKDSRTLRTANDYPNVEERLYKGFRLAEQTQSVEEIETHIQWLMSLEVERETECV